MKKIIALVAVVLLVLGGTWVGLHMWASTLDLPPLRVGEQSVVYASDGETEIGTIAASGGHKWLTPEEVSPLVEHAHMAAEDRSFYTHDGISPQGMAFAMLTNAREGSVAAGGSTITQQFAKNGYLTQEQTIDRKVREIRYAFAIEEEFSKEEILANYVNTNYYGRGAYGIEDGCQAWFGHSATELDNPNDPMDVAKAAFLAAIIKAPGYWDAAESGNPSQLIHLDELVGRQQYVLDGLRDLRGTGPIVSQEVVDQAKGLLPLQLTDTVRPSGRSDNIDPYLLDYIKSWMRAWQTEAAEADGLSGEAAERQGADTAEAMLARGGLKIRTSISPGLQSALRDAVEAEFPYGGLSTGLVVMNPRTGGVAAFYGGHDHSDDANNYALYAERQPGSAIKPVVLANAVENDISVQSVFAAPSYIEIDGPPIENWDWDPGDAFECRQLTLADAMAHSNNPVHVELMTGRMASCDDPSNLSDIKDDYPISAESVAELARDMGAEDSTVPGRDNPIEIGEEPRLAIGDTLHLSPLKLASIASTLANGGEHNKPFIIRDITLADSTIFEHDRETERVLEEDDVRIVNQVLTGVYTYGTAANAPLDDRPIAGKTGTDAANAWAFAFTSAANDDVPAYACAGWGGYGDENRSLDGAVSSATMARICARFLAAAMGDRPHVAFAEANMDAGEVIGLNANQPEPELEPPPEETEAPSPTEEPPPPPPSPTEEPQPEPTASAAPSVTPTQEPEDGEQE